ncbi:MAG TPA: hypothetical protein VE263_10345 [Candidatus Angelobacter sp.]|nr:hypothetical protein [Candidatus Angelobacter sp.]
MTASPNAARSQPQAGGSTLRRNPRSWMLFRLVLALGGAALVLFPVASGNSYIFSVAGLVMFVAAILLLPAQPRITLEDKARELGALLVVDGGRYHLPHSSSSVPVHLFVAADRVSALDSKFRVVLEIPTAEISSFLALRAEKGWFLEVIWSTSAAEFSYRGGSGERLAHIAENALRRVAPAPAPVLPQRRAAGA